MRQIKQPNSGQTARQRQKTARLSVLAIGFGLLAAACNPMTTSQQHEGIGFRQARFAEISAMRDYRQCRDDALALDGQAKAEGSPARYLASARLIEKCEAEVGPEAAGVAVDERMRTYAVGIQNHFKGGDVARARGNLETFKKTFAGSDLYFADGSSFTESMEMLLGLRDRTAVGEFSVANVSTHMKSELRRVRYWTRN
ncbi:MAG: hypothetical protein HOK21_09740 [Rhodospirillaceae bacterium]|jgi:hypothetical protein|nr:hypothetical protein [Rhodospirillaceae bacterium]MBT4043234.1 hypothetical protein [Rhodospirillaceae bacterium]MBT4691411.1 hypothetical protein [Rhodospirillaceae bacterium]MBT5082914.1 hypothetical protein [Rhodospirillaceae bacterium]MBT5524358.1 hypothetical protein [Rhodospirillaceae bacterium]